MAMEISNNYNSYASSYTNTTDSKKKTTESSTTKETTETSSTTRKTAADELEYLSNKYSGYSFVAGVYQKGTKFGSSNTTNVMIDSRFLTKMANDSELEAEYEKQIGLLKDLDDQMKSYYASQGWSCECGTVIDKDGGMSGWTIVTKDPNAKSHLQTMSENAEKIRKANAEKKQERAELEEKRQAAKEEKEKLREKLDEAGKEQFGDKWKGVVVIANEDENAAASNADKDTAAATGLNMDIKA